MRERIRDAMSGGLVERTPSRACLVSVHGLIALSFSVTGQELSLDSSFSVQKLFGRMGILEGHNLLARWFIRTLKKVNPFSLAFVSRGYGEIAHRRKTSSLRGRVVHEIGNFKK